MKPQSSNEALGRNRDEVIRIVFERRYVERALEVEFSIADIREAIDQVKARNPDYIESNVPDVRYEYASGRRVLPEVVNRHGPWMFEGRGKGKYALVKLSNSPEVDIPSDLHTICLPDATPEIVVEYAGGDEQGILARLRYNRLLDIFLQITCYHLQNHWRTTIAKKGQCEIDDLYVGLNTHGKQFVIPVEAKAVGGRLSKTQIVQNLDFARERYPRLIIRPVGVQELSDGSVVLVEFTPASHPDAVKIRELRRYQLVPMSQVPLDELQGQE